MLKTNMIIIFFLLFATNIASANPALNDSNLNVTSLDKILHIEKEFVVTSTEWSPNGQYLLVRSSKSDSPSNGVVEHYLMDTNSYTFGEIDYGVHGPDSNGILQAKWTPSGDKIYFEISRGAGPTDSGNCFVVCDPDGTNLRCIGTNYTDLSYIIKNLGSIGFQRNLNWNQDSSKIAFEWQKPGNALTGVFIANGNGTNACELRSRASAGRPEPDWYDSDKIFLATDKGTVVLVNERDDLIKTFQSENKEDLYGYGAFSLSPDRKKIMFAAGTPGNCSSRTYISNVDGSNLKGNISYDENVWANESWQPNGSLLLVNQYGNLYIVEGDKNNKRLLYEGNASEPQWFPDGKKILFVENGNKLYSINVNGTNLSFITSFGPTYSYFWKYFDEGQHFSISPSGNTIAFMSAFDSATRKAIENNDIFNNDYAAPLFIVNSDGSNLTQVTPAVKGRYDTCINWSPDGKQFTIGSTIDVGNGRSQWVSSLVKLDSEYFSSTWKSLPVKEIIKSEESGTVEKIQINEPDSKNTSQVTASQEIIKQSPSFMFIQPFICIIGIWLLHKSREL